MSEEPRGYLMLNSGAAETSDKARIKVSRIAEYCSSSSGSRVIDVKSVTESEILEAGCGEKD